MNNINEYVKSAIQKKKLLTNIYAELSDTIEKVDFYKTVLALIQSSKIPNILICCCGHDCSKCITFHATLFNDDTLREKSVAFYKTEFNQELPKEKIHCLSGKSDEIMEGCSQCPYMYCCNEKGLNACTECSEYPCQKVNWYIDKYVNKVHQIR